MAMIEPPPPATPDEKTSGCAGPVVVFGTGGSGTRAVAAFLSACDIDMGEKTNGSGDALAFTELLDLYIDEVLATTRSLDYSVDQIEASLCASIVSSYTQAAIQHRGARGQRGRWGFKNPRHIFLLPFIEAAFPGAVFVHVVRDGRDMLLSRNRNQPRKHFASLFGRAFSASQKEIGEFWAKSNLEARQFGLTRIRDRYLAVRIEDLSGPTRASALSALCAALGLKSDLAAKPAEIFVPQESFGRGHEVSFDDDDPDGAFRAALEAFGYL